MPHGHNSTMQTVPRDSYVKAIESILRSAIEKRIKTAVTIDIYIYIYICVCVSIHSYTMYNMYVKICKKNIFSLLYIMEI